MNFLSLLPMIFLNLSFRVKSLVFTCFLRWNLYYRPINETTLTSLGAKLTVWLNISENLHHTGVAKLGQAKFLFLCIIGLVGVGNPSQVKFQFVFILACLSLDCLLGLTGVANSGRAKLGNFFWSRWCYRRGTHRSHDYKSYPKLFHTRFHPPNSHTLSLP